MKETDHKRSDQIQFYQMGLSNFTGNLHKFSMGRRVDMKVDTYHNILKKLNLLNRKIAYLKMDIELSELEFFYDIENNYPHLWNNVEQFAMDVHVLHKYQGKNIYIFRSAGRAYEFSRSALPLSLSKKKCSDIAYPPLQYTVFFSKIS